MATASRPSRSSRGREPGGGQLGPGEDQHLAQVVLADEVRQQGFLGVAVHRVDELLDHLGGGVARRDLDGLGIAQDRLRQPADVLGEGRREHQVLALLRQQLDDPLDVRQEAHVQHPVGLVEDEDLHLPEVGDLLADEVQQPARRGDEDLDPAAQRLDLRIHGHAAVDDRRAQRHGPAIRPDALVHLHRQLARRDEDERPHRMPGGRERGVRMLPETVEDRQREGRRLAGPGLGGSEDVAAREDEGDGGCLDRRRRRVTLFDDGLQQVGRQAE